MADISTEELERIEQEFHSDTGSIKTIKEFVKPEDLKTLILICVLLVRTLLETSLVQSRKILPQVSRWLVLTAI